MDRAQPVDAALLCLPNESKPPPAAFVGARYVHGKVALARALNEGQMHRSPEDERFMNLFGAAAQVVTDQVRKTISAVVGAGESYGAGLVSILQFEGRSVRGPCAWSTASKRMALSAADTRVEQRSSLPLREEEE